MFSKKNKFCFTLLCFLFFIWQNNLPALAQERVFLNLQLEFLGEYQLLDTTFQDTKIGGFSGITYDAQKDLFYVISDDRSYFAPARFYTLKMNITEDKIADIQVEKVTLLKDQKGENYPLNTTDTEGIALSPKNTLFISSEGLANQEVAPFIQEFDLEGNLLSQLRIPNRYLPQPEEKQGIENNLGFESLTIKANGRMNQEPFRLFTVTESALLQDVDLDNPQTLNRSRLMHYVIDPSGFAVLVAEHLYLMDNPPFGSLYSGIPELLALPKEGYLLSLERTFGLQGFGAKIYQLVMGNANDVSNQKSLAGDITRINAINKQLILDLTELDLKLDNLEGITFGPRLSDGSYSLIVISDNNFAPEDQQKNQFLLFKLTGL